MINYFQRKEDELQSEDYFKARVQFLEDYDRTNPITKELALVEWMDFLKEKDEQLY